MYKCDDCGAEFESPDTYYESRPIGWEEFACCPMCESLNYDEYREEDITDE